MIKTYNFTFLYDASAGGAVVGVKAAHTPAARWLEVVSPCQGARN